jgi:hypothetical protein
MIKSRRIRCAAHVAHMVEKRGAFRVSVEKSERKKPLGRPRLGWEGDIKTDLQ